MNANQMKHAASLEDWKQRIMECRASGLPVRTWCAQNAYNTSTYYRWEQDLFWRIKKPPAETDQVESSRFSCDKSDVKRVRLYKKNFRPKKPLHFGAASHLPKLAKKIYSEQNT